MCRATCTSFLYGLIGKRRKRAHILICLFLLLLPVFSVGAKQTPVVSISADKTEITEGEDIVFTLTATPAPSTVLQVQFTIGEITEPGKHFLSNLNPSGWRFALIGTNGTGSNTIKTDNDSHIESDGSIWATVESGAGYNVAEAPNQTVSVAVLDNDTPVVSISGSDAVTEGDDISFTLSLDRKHDWETKVAVNFSQTGNFANPVDLIQRGVRILRNSNTATFKIKTENDAVDEPNGAIHATIADGKNYEVAEAPDHTVSVTVEDDDEPVPAISIAGGTAVTEGSSASFTLSAKPAPEADLDVSITVEQEGVFAAPTELGSRKITLGTGGTANFEVNTVNDAADEPNGAIRARIAGGTGYTVAKGSAYVVVKDDEVPVVSISGGKSVTEGSGASFTLSAIPTPGTDLDVSIMLTQTGNFAASGELGTREITVGTNGSTTFSVNTVHDKIKEDDGSIQATIQSGTDYEIAEAPDHTASVTVEDDDIPVMSITGGKSVTEGNGATFTLRNEVEHKGVWVNVSISQTGDFAKTTALGPRRVYHSGFIPTATFTVSTVDDAVDEANGSIQATIQRGTDYEIAAAPNHTASVTVEDDEVPVVRISGGESVTEGSNASFTLSATPTPGANLAVNVTLSQTGDFAASGELGAREITVGTGGTAIFDVDTVNDAADEENGLIQATIQSGTNYEIAEAPNHTASVTVADDDETTVPDAPTGLNAKASGRTQINLSWTAPDDGGSEITGYRIEVSANTGTSWDDLVTNTKSTATYYNHTELVPSTTRYYRVSAINSVGTGPASNIAHATTDAPAPTTPTAPRELKAVASGSSQIKLSWTAPSDDGGAALTGYRIDVSANAGTFWDDLVTNTEGTATNYDHTELAPSTTRHYRVSAINSVGTGSASNTAHATTEAPPATAPEAPTELKAIVSGKTRINLSWTAPSDDGGAALTGYRIEVSANTGTSWTDLAANTKSTAKTYVHTGLAPSTTRHYRVSAINSVGVGPASNIVNATTEAATTPASPADLNATALGENQIKLSWTVPLNTGGAAITGYQIEVSLDAGVIWSTLVTNTGNTLTAYAHTELTPNTAYSYRVRAINSVGVGPVSNVASATTESTPVIVPTAPSGLRATASGSSQIHLSWVEPSNTRVAAITGYRIEISSNAGTIWSNLVDNTGTAASTYVHAGLTPSTTYHYRVSAINSVGTGPASNVASATTEALAFTVPDAPTSLSASESGRFRINLSWTAPLDDGGEPITGYKIEVSADAGRSWSVLTANTGDASTAYSHTGLMPNTTRHYQVGAVNSVGTGPMSNMAGATTDPSTATVPDAPTGLTAMASGENQINLSWTAPNDGGAVLTGYSIEMSTNAGTKWLHLVSNTGSTATTYTHTDLMFGITYYYRVRAINSVGTGFASNVAQATLETPVITAPTGLIATAIGSSQIDLSWTTPSNHRGATITGYRIEVSYDAGKNWSDLVDNTNSSVTAYVHTGLVPGMTCYYRVSTVTSVGIGPTSNIAHATTDTNVGWTEETEFPELMTIWGNYPNPSSAGTSIVFDLPERAKISVMVTNLLGRTVVSTSERLFNPGRKHTFEISTNCLPSGIYHYTMVAIMQNQAVAMSNLMAIVR